MFSKIMLNSLILQCHSLTSLYIAVLLPGKTVLPDRVGKIKHITTNFYYFRR